MTIQEKLKEAIEKYCLGWVSYQDDNRAISECIEIIREDAIKFTTWTRENYSVSKGKYRHRGDFYRQDKKLKSEADLYKIFQEEQAKQK